ncbi:hypothetical protein YC2023_079453 [Brassica napus]
MNNMIGNQDTTFIHIFLCTKLDLFSMFFSSSALSTLIQNVPFWRLCREEKCGNKGAYLIAKNVTREDRRQSYLKLDSKELLAWIIHFTSNQKMTPDRRRQSTALSCIKKMSTLLRKHDFLFGNKKTIESEQRKATSTPFTIGPPRCW